MFRIMTEMMVLTMETTSNEVAVDTEGVVGLEVATGEGMTGAHDLLM